MQRLGTTLNISNEMLREGEQVICTIIYLGIYKQHYNVNELI